MAKLCALREKDQNFVAALIRADFVDTDTIHDRLDTLEPQHALAAERAIGWLRTLQR